ncbi:hypothetical protein mRhiFer1_009952 [Rhinolophus ferrumequinum]|uniref:Uncharacterized protein n=1 Tax=Rhinolophus ferrumequinum TaxID=59479 RepID=A0A7J7YJ94_RHIFE|nr:hypothetical protein mRhiFer1_009952 [Rhinolophus ferrumequinum]
MRLLRKGQDASEHPNPPAASSRPSPTHSHPLLPSGSLGLWSPPLSPPPPPLRNLFLYAPVLRKEGLARILGTSWDAVTSSEPSPFSCRELGKLTLELLARGRQAENLLCLLGNCNRFVTQFR